MAPSFGIAETDDGVVVTVHLPGIESVVGVGLETLAFPATLQFTHLRCALCALLTATVIRNSAAHVGSCAAELYVNDRAE